MAGEICKYSWVGINNPWRDGTVKVAKIASPTNPKVSSLAAPVVANPLTERLARSPQKIEEADHWSPTQQEVDAYINSLEHELFQGCDSITEQPGNEHKRAASTNDRPSISSALLWGALAITAGCFWWLAKIIFEAVD
jgi:hypothetical protein